MDSLHIGFSLVSSDVEINPQFYWGKEKSFSDEKNGELYASRELHGIKKRFDTAKLWR